MGATLGAGSATEVAGSAESAGATVPICSSGSVELVADAVTTDVAESSGCSVDVSGAGVADSGV